MSKPNAPGGRDFSALDAMTTDELKELLRQDSLLPENEPSDTEAILHIMELLVQREPEPVDVEGAWGSFNEQYRPNPEDAETREEDDAGQTTAPRARRPLRRLLKTAAVLAAAVALLVMGTLTASAFGYNVTETVSLWLSSLAGEAWTDDLVAAQWSDGTFSFECADAANPDWVRTRKTLENHDLWAFADLLPTWMPEGSRQTDSSTMEYDIFYSEKLFYALPDGAEFTIRVTVFSNSQYISLFTADWDGSDVERYSSNGKTVYLIPDGDSMTGICVDDYMETIIEGALTAEEVREMFDSIQWDNIYW
ncbi:MAG: DUF4367 domain-containing protein [Clostridiales bacterium]|nr:DUF4367 domain-containing protein [Clostridiales bacterium]